MNCKIRIHGDQTTCACGLAWDTNDPAPPECRKGIVARQELSAARAILQEPSFLAIKRAKLLYLQEMPMGWLPAFGVPEGLFTVDWPSLPDASYVVITRERGRSYYFYSAKGVLVVEVVGQRLEPVIFESE